MILIGSGKNCIDEVIIDGIERTNSKMFFLAVFSILARFIKLITYPLIN